MSFVDYYQLLELDQTADPEAIAQAIRKQRTEWRRRANHPDQKVRASAEQAIQNISDAETVLKDSVKRTDYDRQLAAHVDTPVPSQDPASSGGRDWVQIAYEYLSSGSASQANYAAREATNQNPDNPEAWYVRGVSSGNLGNAADAEFELGEAIRLNPHEASYHCELGDLYNANDAPARAQVAYQRASDLEPANLFYRVGVATTLTAQGRAAEAVPIIEDVVDAEPDNELFAFHYAIALLDSTTDQWSEYADGTKGILNIAQLALTKVTLDTVTSLKITDPELNAHIDEISRVAERAERVKWYGSDNLLVYLGGFGAALVAMLIFFSIPSTAFLGVLALAAVVAIPIVFAKRHNMPGWKWDAKHSPPFVQRTGLQSAADDGARV